MSMTKRKNGWIRGSLLVALIAVYGNGMLRVGESLTGWVSRKHGVSVLWCGPSAPSGLLSSL